MWAFLLQRARCWVVLQMVLTVFVSSIHAQNTSSSAIPASTFFFEKTETQFSVNLPADSDDVYIYFASPAYSWVGVGFGESMKDSLMLIMYSNERDNNLTISPRLSTSNSEPTFSPSINLTVLPGTGISNDSMFVLKAVCHSCRVWATGSINTTSTQQPMVYAFGPGNGLNSNDPNAPLKRHYTYGKFTMDMRQATGTTGSRIGVPEPASSSSADVQMVGPMVRDHDRMNLAHSVMGCLALFVIWPINVVVAGFFRNIRIHVGVSIFLMSFLVISYALGIATSNEFNRSKSFTSPHQIFAFIALAPILLLSLLPAKPIASLHPKIPTLHTPLTTITLTALIVTGGLGLRLSSSTTQIILVYVAVALIIFVIITLFQLCIRRRGSAYARVTRRRRLGEDEENDRDGKDFGLANYWSKKMGGGSQTTGSSATTPSKDEWADGYGYGNGNVVNGNGAQHGRSASQGSQGRGIYGGGTMPGPHYLLNMHPGVPVTFK